MGGVTGGAGITLRVVSRGSCACAVPLAATNNPIVASTSAARAEQREAKGAELVVCVSLTNERTVYFTP